MKKFIVKLEMYEGAVPSNYDQEFFTMKEVQDYLLSLLTELNAEEIKKAKITEIEIIKDLKVDKITFVKNDPTKTIVIGI